MKCRRTPGSMSIPCKNWVFTVNSWTDSDVAALKLLPYRYIRFAKEIAPSTGTPHLQGYVQLKKRMRRTALVKIIACFWERARGSLESNIRYCSGGEVYEDGHPHNTSPGGLTLQERSIRNKRLLEAPVRELVEAGELHPMHVRSVMNARVDIEQDDRLRSVVSPLDWKQGESPNRWYWGPSGGGKSVRARKEFPGFYDKACNKWWDGYDGKAPVIIDDFDRGHAVLCHHLKRWGDRYPFTGEVKGGTSYSLRPPTVAVTSNYSPGDIWFDDSDRVPIERRFKIVYVPLTVDIDFEV